MDRTSLLFEIRYAERLCQRTARLYRNLETTFVLMSILGGSGVFASLSGEMPTWLALTFTSVFVVFSAFNLALRPSDKAAANDSDMRRYAQLRTASLGMTDEGLSRALHQARETDTPEIEALRDVAYNEAAIEIGRSDAVVALNWRKNLLKVMA